MPTPPYLTAIRACRDAIEAKLLATLSNATRADSDLRNDLESIEPGNTKVQIRMYQIGISQDPDSGESEVPQLGVLITVAHYLSGTEREYTEDQMETELHTLMDPMWWRDIAEVRTVEEDPNLTTTDVARDGNVVSYTFSVGLGVQIF